MFLCSVLIVNMRRSSSLEGEGQNNQGNEVLKINFTDREHINKNTAPPRVYFIVCVGGGEGMSERGKSF